MLVYILGFLAFICFMVSVSSFFDLKESKKMEKIEEEVRREEKEFSEIDLEKRTLRAEKMFRMNQKEPNESSSNPRLSLISTLLKSIAPSFWIL